MWTAWDLGARLPQTGALLAAGTLTFAKARAVDESLAQLTDADAAKAEAMIAPELPGKTYGQAEKLAVAAALSVDPDSAVRRREEAERNRARVALRRDPSGAASLAGYDLPADETLAAHASVCARAGAYRDSGVFAGVRMDQFRAMAYLDLVNGVTAEARIAAGAPEAGLGAPNEYVRDPGETDGPAPDNTCPGEPAPGDPGRADGWPPDASPAGEQPPGEAPAGDAPDDDAPDDDSPDDSPGGDSPGGDGPGGGGCPPPGAPKFPPPAPSRQPPPPRLADLVIPLATLLGLADRPGESHGFGPLDPGLCRSLAAAAASSPHTSVCVTVTGPGGIAAGHGCARPDRRGPPGSTSRPGHAGPCTALPSSLNLTIPADRLPQLASTPAGPKPRPQTLVLHPRPRRPRPARRLRRLAPGPARRPDPDRPTRTSPHRRLRPPPRVPRLPAEPDPAPPGPGPRPRVHLPAPAPATLGKAISSMRCPSTRAAAPARATPAPEAASATRSSKPKAGTSPSPNPAGTNGQPRLGAPTPRVPSPTQPDGDAGMAARARPGTGGPGWCFPTAVRAAVPRSATPPRCGRNGRCTGSRGPPGWLRLHAR